MEDHWAKVLIARWFFRRLWTVVNISEQILAPRAGLPDVREINGLDLKTFAKGAVERKRLSGLLTNLG
jgi:hypothetical protein